MPEASTDPRVYLAVERTLLAWIRTGLGLMGIGFAVARFGLFLREMRPGQFSSTGGGHSVYAGVALVVLGVAVNVSAVLHHVRTVGALRSGSWQPRVSSQAIVLGYVLALVGVGMAVYLLVLH